VLLVLLVVLVLLLVVLVVLVVLVLVLVVVLLLGEHATAAVTMFVRIRDRHWHMEGIGGL
jgi:hypothetical protein